MQEIDWKTLSEMPGSRKLNPKKYQILDSSLQLIHEKGVQGLSVTALSKSTGLSKSLILYHYENNDLILEDLFFFSGKMARMWIEKSLLDKNTFEERIVGMTEGIFRWVLSNKEVGEFFALMFHEATKTEAMQTVYMGIYHTAIELWERIFLESMRYNDLNTIKNQVRAIHSLIQGSLIHMVASKDEENAKSYAELIKFNLEKILDVELPEFKIDYSG